MNAKRLVQGILAAFLLTGATVTLTAGSAQALPRDCLRYQTLIDRNTEIGDRYLSSYYYYSSIGQFDSAWSNLRLAQSFYGVAASYSRAKESLC